MSCKSKYLSVSMQQYSCAANSNNAWSTHRELSTPLEKLLHGGFGLLDLVERVLGACMVSLVHSSAQGSFPAGAHPLQHVQPAAAECGHQGHVQVAGRRAEER